MSRASREERASMKRTPTTAAALLSRCAAGWLLMLCAGGCNPPPPRIQVPPPMEFPVRVEVVDQSDQPVAKVPVLLDGTLVGYTDRGGRFEGVLQERPNFFKAHLSLGTIEGYRFPGGAPPVIEDKLQVTKGMDGKTSGVPLELKARLDSTKNDYLVWVEAACGTNLDQEKCANLPVTLDGEEVARTNDLGIAHFVLHEVPGRELTLGLDTPEKSKEVVFEPADPVYQVALNTEAAEILLVNASFENGAEIKKPTRRRSRRRSSRQRQPRLKQEPKKTEPVNNPDVIDLF